MLITKLIWENLLYINFWGYRYITGLTVMRCLILSILSVPLDIILLPIEVISLFLKLIIEELNERK